MNYLLALSCFALGFASAMLLICRVTLRPQVKQILKHTGVVREHKAIVPKPKQHPVDPDDYVIG